MAKRSHTRLSTFLNTMDTAARESDDWPSRPGNSSGPPSARKVPRSGSVQDAICKPGRGLWSSYPHRSAEESHARQSDK